MLVAWRTTLMQSLSLTALKMIQNVKKLSSVKVEGKTAILVDDILNTGKTFAEAAKILERGTLKTSMQ